jgi:hypothetical protein
MRCDRQYGRARLIVNLAFSNDSVPSERKVTREPEGCFADERTIDLARFDPPIHLLTCAKRLTGISLNPYFNTGAVGNMHPHEGVSLRSGDNNGR